MTAEKEYESLIGISKDMIKEKKEQEKNMFKSLQERYPPSPPCGCGICKSYCLRPGWWTVEEAYKAINAGCGRRMMLEIAPEMNFGVLSPAFKGCEGKYALQEFANSGCNFLHNGLCELHGTGYQPLECRFCHHLRKGMGQKCHEEIEADWKTPLGQALVRYWIENVLPEKMRK